MTPAQRAFVEKLLEDWAERDHDLAQQTGTRDDWVDSRESIYARRAEFERLFPREG